jgi:AcrR family transcriptional regulator
VRTVSPAKRQRILDSAAQLFAQHHYHEVRMDDIAAEAGVAKGTLYLHFKDKEALYLALILDGIQRLFEEVQARIADAADAEGRLRVVVREAVRFYERYPYFVELIQRVEAAGDGDEASSLRASRAGFFDLMTGVLRELDASGHYAVPDPTFAALALIGMLREVLRRYPQPWPAGLTDRLVRQFLHGLASHERR